MDLCQLLNDDLAATVKQHQKRFVALGTLPMQAPELAIRELKRCVKVIYSIFSTKLKRSKPISITCRPVSSKYSSLHCVIQELGFPGVQIGSHINDWNLDAPELISFFAVSLSLCTCANTWNLSESYIWRWKIFLAFIEGWPCLLLMLTVNGHGKCAMAGGL